jgi:hypothetical protein
VLTRIRELVARCLLGKNTEILRPKACVHTLGARTSLCSRPIFFVVVLAASRRSARIGADVWDVASEDTIRKGAVLYILWGVESVYDG